MKSRITSIAALAILTGCATDMPDNFAKNPPPPGPDIYRCVNEDGSPYFRRIKADLFQVWQGDQWGENACAEEGNTCQVDPEEGLIVVERTVILPTSGVRVDMLDIYNPNSGTILSNVAMLGEVLTPSRDACAPFE